MGEKKADQFPRILEVSEKFNIILYSQTISVGLDVPSDLFHYGVHYFKNKTGSQIQFLQSIHRFRNIEEHVIYTQSMIRIEDNYCRELSVAEAYKNSFIIDDYKNIDQDERDEISMTMFAKTFYNCLG